MALGVYKMKGPFKMKRSPFKVPFAPWMLPAAAGALGVASHLMGGGKRRAEIRAAQAAQKKSRAAWEGLDTSNLSSNLENVYEDLTINQKQAQFMKQQSMQQQANVLESLRGTAGGAGVAGLAQVISNQGQIQAQQASASIGQQEAANQKMRARGAMGVQQMELQGEELSRQLEYRKTGTIFGMDMQRLTAAQKARNDANMALMQTLGSVAGAGISG
jgi:hypothetical protein|tara:strand:- start:437 stop:1087 length:651 start_codon:yes stop_codon:yes gene_type:complete